MQSSQSSVEEEAKQGSDILYTHCTLHMYSCTVSYSMHAIVQPGCGDVDV